MKLIDYTTCVNITSEKRDEYMLGAEPFDYDKSIKLIKEQMPIIYEQLSLHLYNPRRDNTFITGKHLIITWSAIEYFIVYE